MQEHKLLKTMRISTLTVVLLSVFFSVNAQEYKIDFTVNNLQAKEAYLGYHFGDKQYVKDTAEVNAGKVIFQGEGPLEGGIYFLYTPDGKYFEFLVDEQNFSLETDTTNFVENMQVEGSENNEIFFNYQRFLGSRSKLSKELSEKMQNVSEAEKEKITAQLKEINTEVEQYQEKIIKEHSDKLVAKIIKATKNIDIPEAPEGMDEQAAKTYQYNYYKQHYFDNIDFSDVRLLRTPILHGKLLEYVDKLTPQHPDSIAKSARYVIDKAKADPEVFRYVLVTYSNKYETSNIMGMENVFVDLARRYYLSGQATWADSTLKANIAKRVMELSPNLVGEKARNFYLIDTTLQNPVVLYDQPDPYLVVYFYDPECGHCKKTTPVLHEEYVSTLKDKGVEVMAVNIKNDVKKWKDFIKKHDLSGWINAADPDYRDNFRAYYNIVTTPRIFVLDKNKEIIAKGIGVEQIAEFVDHHKKTKENQP